MTDRNEQLWADAVISAVTACDWNKITKICDKWEDEGEIDEDYYEALKGIVEIEFPNEEIEGEILPLLESGSYEEWLNAYRAADSLPCWQGLKRALTVVAEYGW